MRILVKSAGSNFSRTSVKPQRSLEHSVNSRGRLASLTICNFAKTSFTLWWIENVILVRADAR